MAEAMRKEAGSSWISVIWSARQDPAARQFNLDLLAALIAFLLPWTTTGVAIAVVLWIVALGFAVEPKTLVRSLKRPASALPLLLFLLVLVGTLWSDAPWH